MTEEDKHTFKLEWGGFRQEILNNEPILKYFHYMHYPEHLQTHAIPFCDLAENLYYSLPKSSERTVALRKLLESRDTALRADQGPNEAAIESEPVETGGFDIDRDGPIPFNS